MMPGPPPSGGYPGRHWDRFWEKVTITGFCWYWEGAKNFNGYGQLRIGDTNTQAHRTSYEVLVGPIPEGLVLDHLCRTRSCVNPDHLEPVTQGENARRGLLGRTRVTHCPAGHPYRDNTYLSSAGRQCRICKRGRVRRHYHQQKPNLSGRTPA